MFDCPRCEQSFYGDSELFHHALTAHSQKTANNLIKKYAEQEAKMDDDKTELTRGDFVEKDNHQWVAKRNKYTYVVRKLDSVYEIIIRPVLTSDPTPVDWDDAIRVCNYHVKNNRIAETQTNVDLRESSD